MMGTGAFIYSNRYSEYGMAGVAVLGPGALIAFTLFKVLNEVSFRFKNGRWTKPENSSWFKGVDGKIRWTSLIPVICSTACNLVYIIVMTYAWDFATQAGLN